MTASMTSNVQARQKQFDALCTPHRPALLRYSRSLTRDPETAEDVVQTALLRAWSNIHTLADGNAARSWLITITRREMARAHERKRLATVDIQMLSPDDEMSISCQGYRGDRDLGRAANSLCKRDRELLLQIIQGYSIEEIAEQEGCRPGNISVRLFRARKRLREIL
jgi:RNA polymerase sigma-70 factor (ECF subfamily)